VQQGENERKILSNTLFSPFITVKSLFWVFKFIKCGLFYEKIYLCKEKSIKISYEKVPLSINCYRDLFGLPPQ